MEYTAITPTGARPEAFKLCVRYVDRQLLRPKEWVIVDDADMACDIFLPEYASYHCRPTSNDKEGEHTLPKNILYALEHRKYPDIPIVIFEDDDWYSPNHALYLLQLDSSIVGGENIVYYHVVERKWRWMDSGNASFCQMMFRPDGVSHLIEACKKSTPFIDRELKQFTLLDKHPTRSVIGIKGMPGRRGMTYGHTRMVNDPTCLLDPDLSTLRKMIGDDAATYERFAK